jgi:hypothetical protein
MGGSPNVNLGVIGNPDLCSRELDGLPEWAEPAVIATAHPSVDHQAVFNRVPQVLDLRGHTRKIAAASATRL